MDHFLYEKLEDLDIDLTEQLLQESVKLTIPYKTKKRIAARALAKLTTVKNSKRFLKPVRVSLLCTCFLAFLLLIGIFLKDQYSIKILTLPVPHPTQDISDTDPHYVFGAGGGFSRHFFSVQNLYILDRNNQLALINKDFESLTSLGTLPESGDYIIDKENQKIYYVSDQSIYETDFTASYANCIYTNTSSDAIRCVWITNKQLIFYTSSREDGLYLLDSYFCFDLTTNAIRRLPFADYIFIETSQDDLIVFEASQFPRNTIEDIRSHDIPDTQLLQTYDLYTGELTTLATLEKSDGSADSIYLVQIHDGYVYYLASSSGLFRVPLNASSSTEFLVKDFERSAIRSFAWAKDHLILCMNKYYSNASKLYEFDLSDNTMNTIINLKQDIYYINNVEYSNGYLYLSDFMSNDMYRLKLFP